MLPILDLDFSAFCLGEGDFFQPQTRHLGVWAFGFPRAENSPHRDKLPEYLTAFLVEYFCEFPMHGSAVIFYAPLGTAQYVVSVGVPDFEDAQVVLPNFSGLEDTLLRRDFVHLPATSTPFALINGTQVTRLYALNSPYNLKRYYVEDWGNPYGVVSEAVGVRKWREFGSREEKEYASVPRHAVEAYDASPEEEWDAETTLIRHAFYKVPVSKDQSGAELWDSMFPNSKHL